MLKSMLLSSVRPTFAPDDDKRSDAQKERDKIKVTTSKTTEEPEKEEPEKEERIEKPEGEKEEGGEDDAEEGDEEAEDGEKEEKELTLDEYKAEIEAAKKKIARLEKRTGRTAGERDQLRKDLAAARASLDAKVEEGKGLGEEEVERRAGIKANELAGQREFDNAVKTLTRAATKIDPEFMAKVHEMANDVAPLPPFMIGALEDLDNGGAVLAHLANNPDTYEEIFELSPAKMVTRLAKISAKLEEDAKPKKKAISKIPAPIDTIKGGSESPNVLSDKPNKDAASMEKFVKQRQQQEADRRKARLGG